MATVALICDMILALYIFHFISSAFGSFSERVGLSDRTVVWLDIAIGIVLLLAVVGANYLAHSNS